MTRQEPIRMEQKKHIVLRVLAVLAVFCLFVAGGVLWLRGNSYGAKTPFYILEIAPAKEQAVLGYYIGASTGTVDRGLSEEQIQAAATAASTNVNAYVHTWKYFFFDPNGKNGNNSGALQPYTVIEEDGKKKAVNNEIFKLICLQVGTYDSSKTVYENYVTNQKALTDFDSRYEIHLTVKEPKTVTEEDIKKAQYIHFDSGNKRDDIAEFDNIYEEINGSKYTKKFYRDGDITFAQAKLIYQRAIQDEIALSLPGQSIVNDDTGKTSNVYKLYMMINYFDDPCEFQKLFRENAGESSTYVDSDGKLYVEGTYKEKWTFGNLKNAGTFAPHISDYDKHQNDGEHDTYIPSIHDGTHDNLLIYKVKKGENGFFSDYLTVPFEKIKIILSGKLGSSNPPVTPDNPDNPEDGSVRVLEIQPCASYRFGTADGRKQLATYLYGDATKEKYLHITCVTPDLLNGMTVDLSADYDVIYIGDQTDLFAGNTIYKTYPYSHMGDVVRTDTLINGLRPEDYITRTAFTNLLANITADVNLAGNLLPTSNVLWNKNLKEQWKERSETYFLRNMSLVPTLEAANTTAGQARFSGNDITDSIREQLKEFIENDMPVITTSKIMGIASAVKTDLDSSGTKPQSPSDANLYQVLAETGQDGNKKRANLYQEPETVKEIPDFALAEDGPKVSITFTDNETIAPVKPAEDEEERELLSLTKSNTLTFSYTGGDTASIKVFIDRNGDGMFTTSTSGSTSEGGAGGGVGGSSGTSGSISGGQTEGQPKELQTDYVYQPESNDGEISIELSSLGLDDEVYQFQIVAEKGKRRSRDRGYFRPLTTKRDVKVLQITPNEKESWDLTKNNEFMGLLKAVTEEDDTTEYGNVEFEVKTCEQISDASSGLALDEYDLIIFGVGFDSEDLLNGETDIRDTEAIEKLRVYIEDEKRPVIFTNDSMSYVNSLNYMAPKQVKYVWKQMTVGDYNKFTENGTKPLTDDGVNYRKTTYELNIPAEKSAVDAIIKANTEVENDQDKIYISGIKKESMAGYRRVIAPLPDSVNDGRSELKYLLGVQGVFSYASYYIPDTGGTAREVGVGTISGLFSSNLYKTEQEKYWNWMKYHYLYRGPVTLEEFKKGMENTVQVKLGSYWEGGRLKNKNAYFKDIYSAFVGYDQIIPANRIDNPNQPVYTINDRKYYVYDGMYLAWYNQETAEVEYQETWEYAVEDTSGTEEGDTAKQSYSLVPVAGNEKALYPNQPSWNYYLTQSFRNTLGMDRFGITITEQERKDQDKDLGSVRYKQDKKKEGVWEDFKKDQLQGFTDGTLLEYGAKGTGWNQPAYYNSTEAGFQYGAKNRTSRIESVNPGAVSQYPYSIVSNETDLIPIKENHAPYYQLDLNRRNQTSSGDVTVWFTLSGTPKGPSDDTLTEASAYFGAAAKQVSNNYYLYSKGNLFYTGFSMYQDADEEETSGQESEQKLFINTIFAALKTSDHRRDETIYTVVKEEGNTGAVQISKVAGESSSYVSYYDEGDTQTDLYFSMEREAAENETTPIQIGIMETIDGVETFRKLEEGSYTLVSTEDLAEETSLDLSAFPLVPYPEEGAEPVWAKLTLTWSEATATQWDGKTLEIQVLTSQDGGTKNPKAVHAKVLMICRELFDLD